MFSIISGTLNRRELLPKLLKNTIFSSSLVELIRGWRSLMELSNIWKI